MTSKEQAHSNDDKARAKRQPSTEDLELVRQETPQALTIQKARLDPRSLTTNDMLQLQRMIGNLAVNRLLVQGTSPTQKHAQPLNIGIQRSMGQNKDIIQRRANLESDKLNVVGENHSISEEREEDEKRFCEAKTNDKRYETEVSMKVGTPQVDRVHGDDILLRILQVMTSMVNIYEALSQKLGIGISKQEAQNLITNYGLASERMEGEIKQYIFSFGDYAPFADEMVEWDENGGKLATALNKLISEEPGDQNQLVNAEAWKRRMRMVLAAPFNALKLATTQAKQDWVSDQIRGSNSDYMDPNTYADRGVSMQRSIKMDEFIKNHGGGMKGIWKVGQRHVDEMRQLYQNGESDQYNLINAGDFETEYTQWKSGKSGTVQ